MSEEWVTLYKYLPIEHVAEIIENHRLLLSDGSNFNDPFELLISDKSTNVVSKVKGLHILCLTNTYQNKLMWAHYADSHKGVCLTVKVPKRHVRPLCYTKRRIFSDSNIDEILANGKYKCKKNVPVSFENLSYKQKTAYIKDQKWFYECEYRLVFEDNQGLIVEGKNTYMSVKITTMYCGVNFDKNKDSDKEKIFKSCENQGIKIKYIEKSKTNFSLQIKQ